MQHIIFLPSIHCSLSFPREDAVFEGNMRKLGNAPLSAKRLIQSYLVYCAALSAASTHSSKIKYSAKDSNVLSSPSVKLKEIKSHVKVFTNLNKLLLHEESNPRNEIIAFQSIASCDNPENFDSYAVDLCLDTCVTGGLTGYKQHFAEGTFVEKDLGNATTVAGTSQVSGYGIAHYVLSDNYGRTADLKVPMNY